MKIAFLGTGLMGAPMVRRLTAAGHTLTVWNRTADKASALADVATPHPTPEGAVDGVELVILMLLDGPVTRDVVEGEVLDTVPRGTSFINMGSVDPATDIALARQAAAAGCAYLDAPVSGGVVGAEQGTLSIFVGGDPAVGEALRPVFEVMGRPNHMGASGAGQLAKLANQLIVAGTIAVVAEGLKLAESGGCDPAALRMALMGGFADSRILELHGGRMVTGDYAPGGRCAAQLKDINNALAVAAANGLDLPAARTVQSGFRDLVEAHDGADLDHSAYFQWLDKR